MTTIASLFVTVIAITNFIQQEIRFISSGDAVHVLYLIPAHISRYSSSRAAFERAANVSVERLGPWGRSGGNTRSPRYTVVHRRRPIQRSIWARAVPGLCVMPLSLLEAGRLLRDVGLQQPIALHAPSQNVDCSCFGLEPGQEFSTRFRRNGCWCRRLAVAESQRAEGPENRR